MTARMRRDPPVVLSTLTPAKRRLWSLIFRFFSFSSVMNCCSMAVSASFLVLMKSSNWALSLAMVSCLVLIVASSTAILCRVSACATAEVCAHSNGLNSNSSSSGKMISPSVTCALVSQILDGEAADGMGVTYFDILDMLAEGDCKLLILQRVDHANTLQQVGLAEVGRLLEQEMRQDGGPFVVAALEFVP